MFVPYFMMGVFSVACLESVHFALWDFGRRTAAAAAASATDNGGAGAGAGADAALRRLDRGAVGYVYRVLHCSDARAAAFPWVHASPWLAWLYPSEPPLGATRYALSGPRSEAPEPRLDAGSDGDSDSDGGGRGELGRAGRARSAVGLVARDRKLSAAAAPERVSPAVAAGHLLWRFTPDLLSVAVGLVMSPLVRSADAQVRACISTLLCPIRPHTK